jgi:hypothetical protein
MYFPQQRLAFVKSDSLSGPGHHDVSLKVRPTMQLTTMWTNLDTDENQAIDKTDQRMRPQALLGQMMWYAIYMMRDNRRCQQDLLNAAETAPMRKQASAIQDDLGR